MKLSGSADSPSVNKKYHIYFTKDLIIFIGSPLDSEEHRHYAIQLTFGLDHPFQIKSPDGVWQTLSSAIIPTNCPHLYDGTAGTQFFMLINPLSKMGRFISRQWINSDEITPLDQKTIAPLADTFQKLCEAPDDTELLRRVLSFFSPPPDFLYEKIDERIGKVLDIFDNLEEKIISLKELASHVCLSESRLLHLFKKEVGNSLRRHLLWIRTLAAIRYVMDDHMSFTEACHAAGFADSSHLSRTFKEMFGVTPTEIAKNSQFIQAKMNFLV